MATDEQLNRLIATLRECSSLDEAASKTGKTVASIRGVMTRAGMRATDFMTMHRRGALPPLPRAVTPAAESDEIHVEWDDGEPTIPIQRAAVEAAREPEPEVDPVQRKEESEAASRQRRQMETLIQQLREARKRQAFIDGIANAEPPRIMPRETSSGLREMTPIVLASDWHCEEVVEPESVAYRNEFNLSIAEHRIERFFNGIIWNIEHHRASKRIAIRDLVLWLGGDMMTGFIHEELLESNALSPTETIRWLQPKLASGIATLLERLQLERIVVPCSYGNHGRTTIKTRISTGYANSFEWLMYHSLADQFTGEPRVQFEITNSAHQYVQVYDFTAHFHHGDDVRYMGGVGGLGIPLLKAVPLWDRIRPADIHCIGHHHTLRDFGRAVSNGSLIGFGPYSQRIRSEFEPPQQAMFYVDKVRGKSMVTALWVADAEKKIARSA